MAQALKQLTFDWQGFNKRKEKTRGVISASSLAIARAELRRQGINVKKIRKQATPLFGKKGKKITSNDVTVFSRQLATMLSAGIPLVQAFDIVGRGHSNPSMQKVINDIKQNVEAGNTLAESLQKHPKYFNDLFCNLVDAGEQSGSLDNMLDRVATYKEKIESLKGKIKKALFYPTAVMVVAFLVTAGLLIFVVPQFESLFQGFGADLPVLTQVVIAMSEWFQAYWFIFFSAIGIGLFSFIKAKQKSKKFAFGFDKFLLRTPVIGKILEKAAIARFARTLAITFAAGLPLIEALKSVAGATGNLLYARATDKIRDEISTGQQMQIAMRNTSLFPNMAIQMVAIGEESGSLESMLSKLADFFEEDVDNAVDGLSSLLEPLIMAILGTLVGGLVVAMYLPIFQLGSVV